MRLTLAVLCILPMLSVGCIKKKKYDAAMDDVFDLTAELSASQDEVDSTQKRVAELEAQNKANRDSIATLKELRDQLEAQNANTLAQLEELKGHLDDMSTRSRKDRDAKAALQATLDKMAGDSAAMQTSMDDAKGRIEALEDQTATAQAEVDRLLAEKADLEARTAEYDQLVDGLQSEIDAGNVTISELGGKTRVQLSNAILFDSGSTKLKGDGVQALRKVASVLAEVEGRLIEVEGHTDDDPVNSRSVLGSNWGLSAMRASKVVELLVANGVSPKQIAVVGFGEHQPVADNGTAKGKAANRRTEIVLAPRLAD